MNRQTQRRGRSHGLPIALLRSEIRCREIISLPAGASLMLLDPHVDHPHSGRLKNIEQQAWNRSSLTRQVLGPERGTMK